MTTEVCNWFCLASPGILLVLVSKVCGLHCLSLTQSPALFSLCPALLAILRRLLVLRLVLLKHGMSMLHADHSDPVMLLTHLSKYLCYLCWAVIPYVCAVPFYMVVFSQGVKWKAKQSFCSGCLLCIGRSGTHFCQLPISLYPFSFA